MGGGPWELDGAAGDDRLVTCEGDVGYHRVNHDDLLVTRDQLLLDIDDTSRRLGIVRGDMDLFHNRLEPLAVGRL